MRRMLRLSLATLAVLALSATLTLGSAVLLGGGSDPEVASSQVEPAALERPSSGDLTPTVTALQHRLRAQPRDHRAWSTLALAYVEQARVSADPGYYPRAERALARAARLAPGDDLQLTGRATLAAARHDFTAALNLADRAITANPYSAQAHAVRSDALTELGRYDEARSAATRADRLSPGTSTFARLSYAAELRGDITEATRLMHLARDAAAGAADYAFAAFHLGELARTSGHPSAAARHYADALRADPAYSPARAGRARLAVARGDRAAAERDYLAVVRRLPLPEYVVELGELYQAWGRPRDAARQFAVARAGARLARAGGVGTDLETALLEADHGSPAAALVAARAEWQRRQSIHAADALAWALHVNGRDGTAIGYARRATSLGTRDARLLFHRGAIEAGLGLSVQARRHLSAALAVDGASSPLRETQARRLLAGRGGAR